MKIARVVAAALFVVGSTCALAQTSSQSVDPRVPQKNPSDAAPPPPPPSAAPPSGEGVGSRSKAPSWSLHFSWVVEVEHAPTSTVHGQC